MDDVVSHYFSHKGGEDGRVLAFNGPCARASQFFLLPFIISTYGKRGAACSSSVVGIRTNSRGYYQINGGCFLSPMLGAAHARRFRIAPKISPMLGIKTDRTSNSEEEEAKSGELFIHSTQNTVYLVRTFAYTTSTRRNPIQLYRMYIVYGF